MVEVECRTCLGMSTLDTSVSISKKFLLGKSIKEVILLFVPQMVAIIWVDDIICFTCSETLHAFAQLIEQVIGTEKSLKRDNKRLPNDSRGNTIVEDKNAEDLRDQSTSTPQDDSLKIPSVKWENCRTCLLAMSSSQSTKLTEQLLQGKTFKEVILYFVPTMISVPCVGENICPNCAKTLRDFAGFIERCVEVEEIFRKAEAKMERERVAIIERMQQNLHNRQQKKQLSNVQGAPEPVDEANFKLDKPVRTYSRKLKIKEELVEFIGKEEPLDPPQDEAQHLLSDPDYSHILVKQERAEPSVEPVFVDASVDQKYLPISTKLLSDTSEEIVWPVTTETRHIAAEVNQENVCNDESTATHSSSLVVKPLDHRNGKNQTNATNFTECPSVLPPKSQTVSLDGPSCSKNKDNVNNTLTDKSNVVKEDSVNSYPVNFHDTVVSVSHSGKTLLPFLKAVGKHDILIYHYGVPKSLTNKRVLLLGSVMVPCPICKKLAYTQKTVTFHIESEHGVKLPESEEEQSHSHVIFPTKEFQESQSEDNTLYVCDNNSQSKTINKEVHRCPLCETTTHSGNLLTRHIRQNHKDFDPYKCSKCGKSFKSKQSYGLHVKKFQDFPSCDLKRCKICSQMVTRENFASHVEGHQSFGCPECGHFFLSSSDLKKHRRIHKLDTSSAGPKREGSFLSPLEDGEMKKQNKRKQLCPICGKLTGKLSVHIETHGPRTRKYPCSKCPKSFLSATSRSGHIRRAHHNENYDCKECKKKCKSHKSLKDHMELKHLEVFKHSCKICGQKFARGDYFRRHMKNHIVCDSDAERPEANSNRGSHRKYSSPGTAQCKYCQKSFKSIYVLRSHLFTHVKKMRYKCRICSGTFSNLNNRLRHEKKHNDPTFEFRCKICFNHTNSKEELEDHMKKHEMTKKYKCQHCEERFSRKYLLSDHIAVEHTSTEELQKEKSAIFSTGLEEFLIKNNQPMNIN